MPNRDISAAAIKSGLTTRFLGQNIIYYPLVTSTMEAARAEAHKAAADGTVIIAGEQTSGRGRLQRRWISPGGNIALSIILYPDIAGLPYLIMIAALAASRSIESTTGLETQIKWPNDILIKGKKVAGILIENEVKGDRVARSVIGIGINAGLLPDKVSEIASIATSLEAELGKNVSRENIIVNLLTGFERLYLNLPDGEPIFKAWRDKLVTLGQKVTATWGKDTLHGIAESVDKSGALTVRLSDGTLTRVVAGDVTLHEK